MPLDRFGHAPRLVRFGLGLAVGVILFATLTPGDVTGRTPPVWCVVCGERGVADFILNIILFLPLGGMLRLAGTRLPNAFFAGCFLSLAVELTQALIPGRDTTLGDVISNTTGCVAGFLLMGVALTILHPPYRRAAIVAIASLAFALGAITVTGKSVTPNFPGTAYYGQWTADLDGGLDWYRGHVLQATLGTMPVPSWRLSDQPQAHALLRQGAPLEVTLVAGPAPQRIAPIFSIYDDRQREILLLGPRGRDLVLRYRTQGLAWHIDQPYISIAGAFAEVRAGDTVHLALWREGGRFCVTRDSLRACDLGFTAGAGWSVLIYPESFPPWLRALLGAAWVGGLLFLIGFSAPTRQLTTGLGAVALTGLAVLPHLVGLLPTPPLEWTGALAGLGVGLLVRQLAMRIPIAAATRP